MPNFHDRVKGTAVSPTSRPNGSCPSQGATLCCRGRLEAGLFSSATPEPTTGCELAQRESILVLQELCGFQGALSAVECELSSLVMQLSADTSFVQSR